MYRITCVQVELCISHIEKTIAKNSPKFVIIKSIKCQTISLKPLIIQIWSILNAMFYDLGIMANRKKRLVKFCPKFLDLHASIRKWQKSQNLILSENMLRTLPFVALLI